MITKTISYRFFFILSTILLFSIEIYSQNITLKTQAEVNAFNPSIESIDGNLQIGFNQGLNDPSDITDLSNLQNLKHISGKLTLIYNPNLQNLVGFHNLDSIGAFSLIKNESIVSLDDLENLKSIDGNIFISQNDALEDISNLPLSEKIEYRFFLSNCENLIDLPSFDHVIEASDIVISNLPITSLDIFPNLEVINGELDIRSNRDMTNITGFAKLREIQDGFNLSTSSSLITLDAFNSLENVNGRFRIYENGDLLELGGFSSLQTIGNFLEIAFNYELIQITGLDTLMNIGGGITISNNSDLVDINFLKNIDEIGGSLTFKTNVSLTSLLPLINLKNITGTLEILQNYNLPSLDGLNNIKTIDGDLIVFNQSTIKNLDIFSNLETVGGELIIQGNDRLTNIDGLKGLRDFDGAITIMYSDDLINIDGLSTITSSGDITIRNNSSLLQINGLFGVKLIQGDLIISDNPSLNGCCAINLLQIDETAIITGNILLEDNGPNCEESSFDDCTFNLVKGEVFFDKNADTNQDLDEYGIPNLPIQYIDSNHYSLTYEDGNFLLPVEKDNTYEITPLIYENFFITTEYDTVFLTIESDSSLLDEYTFGIASDSLFFDGEIGVFFNQTRCSEFTDLVLRVQNLGTLDATGTVRFNIPEELILVLPNLLQQDTAGYFLNFDTLKPFQLYNLTIPLLSPDFSFIGDTLRLGADLFFDQSIDSLLYINDAYTESVVVCSYDPNDKQVSPIGQKEESYTLISDELTYTIRFQNTGNAPAIQVRILDTLDQNIDMTSFRVLGSSHEMTTIVDDHAVEFLFNDIWLVDSLTNPEESQGYLQYKVNVIPEIEELTVINNNASIYFDSNPPIVTNTTKNTMVESICCDVFTQDTVMICEGEMFLDFNESGDYEIIYEKGITCDSIVMLHLIVLPLDDPFCLVNTETLEEQSLKIIPNPFQDRFQILSTEKITSIKLYNLQSELIQSTINKDGFVNTMSISPGVYILEAENEHGFKQIEKIIKL